jgi:co-chaperonin GroES (HSP10)
MKPIADRVLVEVEDSSDEEIKGGVIIPAHIRKEQEVRFGTVIGVGPQTKEVHEGDLVALPRYAAHEFNLDDKPCVIVREDELLGIMP